MVRTKHKNADAVGEASPAPSVDAAIEAVEEMEARQAEAEQARRATDARLYCTLLARAEKPEPSDAAELANMLADGFVTAEVLQKHRTAAAELRRLIELHAQRDEAKGRLKPLVDKRDALRKRLENEIREAEAAVNAAYGFSWQCSTAAREISRLVAAHKYFGEGGLAEILGYTPRPAAT